MTAPPPLPSAGRADRARRAASTVDPSNPIRPGPRSCPRRAGHGQRPRPRTREPNGPRRCMWAISVPCALPDRIMRMGQWATCRTDHAAHAKAHVRAGIADHPDGPWTVQGMVPRTTLTDHGPFGGPTKYVVHAKAHAGTATRTTPGPWTGPDDGVPVHRATVQGPYGPVGGRTRFMRSMAREPIAIGPVSPNAHGAKPCASRGAPGTGAASPTVDEQAPDRGRLPVRQEPAPAGAAMPGLPASAGPEQTTAQQTHTRNKTRHENQHPDRRKKHDTETRNNEDRTKNPHSQPQGTTPSENPRKSTSRCNLRRRWTSCTHRLAAAAYRRNGNVFDGVCRPDVRYRGSALSTGRETRAGWGRHERWEHDPGAARMPGVRARGGGAGPAPREAAVDPPGMPEPAPGGAEEGTGTRTPHVAGVAPDGIQERRRRGGRRTAPAGVF